MEKDKIRVESPDGGKKLITAEFIVLATGSRTQSNPDLEFDGEKVLSSTDAINLEEIPKRITIIGGNQMKTRFSFHLSAVALAKAGYFSFSIITFTINLKNLQKKFCLEKFSPFLSILYTTCRGKNSK